MSAQMSADLGNQKRTYWAQSAERRLHRPREGGEESFQGTLARRQGNETA